jgi:signal transduction histidine kinase
MRFLKSLFSNKTEDFEKEYKEQSKAKQIAIIPITASITFIILLLYIYSDWYIRKIPILSITRIPSILLAIILIVLNKRKTFSTNVIYLLFIVWNYSLMFMMFSIAILGYDTVLFKSLVPGIMVVIFAICIGLTGGAKILAPLYFIPFILFTIAIPIFHSFDQRFIEFINIVAVMIACIVTAQISEGLRKREFKASKELNVALAVVHDQKIQVESTLEELKETQEQLIHAEKFAALGQLVAGVAHEINNPIGAIKASAERIEDELEFGKREFPEYFRNLQEHEIPIFNELLDRSLSNKVILTTKEERNRKKIIKQSLESLEFSSSDKRSLALEYLSNLGITDKLDTYFTVMKEDKFLKTINIVDRFVSQNKSLRNIYISVEKASKVVFALRKFLNTNIKTEKKTISIREELEKVIKVYDNYINGFIEVSFEIREDVKLTCLADEMSQVWRNIIFNSIQAMYSTEKNLKITLECERDSDNSEKKMAIVKISDTGMGMTQEIKEKVYTPFFTTKPAGEGIGLGLFISRRIIEEHGGEITFTSEVGNTEFMVRIPI